MRFPTASAAVLLSLIVGACATATPADYLTAAEKFEDLSRRSAKAGTGIPRYRDHAAAVLLDTLTDTRRFLDTAAFGQADLATVMAVCGEANSIMATYLMSGVKEQGASATIQVGANVMIFSEELTRLVPFNLRCLGKLLPRMAGFVRSLAPAEFDDARRSGLQQARDGSFETFSGALEMVADNSSPPLDRDLRRAILAALAETAPAFASAMDPANHEAAAAQAIAALASVPADLRPEVVRILAAVAETKCDDLCRK